MSPGETGREGDCLPENSCARKMSDVAVDGVALYSGLPNHLKRPAWVAAQDKLASSVHWADGARRIRAVGLRKLMLTQYTVRTTSSL